MTTQTAATEGNGHVQAAEEMVRVFNELRDEILSTLAYVLGNDNHAQDAAQDAFIKCWNAREGVSQIKDVRAWIFRICFNTAKDMQRSGWQRRARPLGVQLFTRASKDAAPEDVAERQEEIARLRAAISLLREEEREVFLLRQNGDMTYEQIAELRDCPVSTVKTQMRSALDKLRRVLA